MACADTAGDPAVRAKMQLLAEDAQQGKLWAWGWGSVLSVSAAGQLTLAALVDDEDFRIDRLVGGGTSVVGVLAVIVTHPRAMRASRKLGTCPSAEEVDLAIEQVAAEERFARAWYQHVLGAAFNLGAGLYLGLAHEHWVSGSLQAVLGTVSSEAMIFTRPHRLADFAIAPMISSVGSGYGLRSYGVTVSIRL